MSKEYNSQAFTPEEVKKGLHLDLLKTLLDYNSKSDDHYNDIHVTTDGFCTIIEWACIPYSHEWGGNFIYVDEDEVVMVERQMPDDTYQMFNSEEEYQEALKDFLAENPQYKINEFGHWYDADAQARWEEEIRKEAEDTK